MNCNIDEILRYMRAGGCTSKSLLDDVKKTVVDLDDVCRPTLIYAFFELEHTDDGFLLKGSDVTLKGNTVNSFIKNATAVILLCATMTNYSDILIEKALSVSAYQGLITDAFFTAELEAFIDNSEKTIFGLFPNYKPLKRFSAGYGDFSIEYQKDFLKLLNAKKEIGVNINDLNMMIPNKSVTAIIPLIKE